MEVQKKVNSFNVLANKSVNVPKTSWVTKSPLTFPKKPERPQKSKINNIFSVSSVCKPYTSPAGNCGPAVQPPSAVSGKVSTSLSECDSPITRGSSSTFTSLDASLGFPMDEWDDFDDFETPANSKNDSCCPGISGKSTRPASSTSEKNPEPTVSCQETEKPEQPADVSPGTSFMKDPAQYDQEDSPVKVTRRRPPAHLKSVVSDSEEDNDVPGPFEGNIGNKLMYCRTRIYFLH